MAYYSSTPPDLARYGTAPPDLASGIYPHVVLSAKKPVPAPTVKPKAIIAGVPTTVADPSVLNPAPQAGQGPYGKVPGPIEYPTTPYAEATRIYPGLTNLTPQAGEEIRSQIAGEFTPMEENALWDLANRFGVASGMPGAQLWSNKFFDNRIKEGMARRQQGVENYNLMLANLSKLGVDPALAAEIAARNATMGAAPDPEAAAKALEAAYRNAMVSPAAGTRNPLGTNTYGQGFQFPTFPSSPSGGTRTPTYPTPSPYTPPAAPTVPGTGTFTTTRTGDDTWFDPGYSNAEVDFQDWFFDPGYNNQGELVGDDTWFDPGYANTEVNPEDWWFDPGYNNQGQLQDWTLDEEYAFPEWDFYEG